jgi:hypothetical protein
VAARLGRCRRLQEPTSVAPGCLRPDSSARFIFTRTLRFSLTDAPCRACSLHRRLSRAGRSVHRRQIPSRRDAPRHSPPEPEHLLPWSLTPLSRREPPHPNWFCHQPQCFRHIRHALRCALGRRSRGFKALGTPSVCRSSVSVNSTFHEHTTSIMRTPTSATGQLPASGDRMPEHVALRFRCFVPRLRSAGSPVAGGDCRGPHRGCSASHWVTHVCVAHWPSPPPRRPLIVVDLPPLEVVRTPHVTS